MNIKSKRSCFIILLILVILLPGQVSAAEHFVSTTGNASAEGSRDDPWDIQTALGHPQAVKPGDTIWVREGTYSGSFTSYLHGEANAPLILRAYPGERVTFDTQTPAGSGNNPDLLKARHNWWWGIEITNSRTENRGGGFILKSSRSNKFINMVIHDLGNNTFGNGDDIYGSILYNNGNYQDKRGHQLYTQNPNTPKVGGEYVCPHDPNRDPSVVEDSIVFQSFAFGMHGYAGGVGCLENIHLIGSVWFNNGLASAGTGGKKDDILIGGKNNQYFIKMVENMTWAKGTVSERTAGLGRYGDFTCDFDIIDNYLIGVTSFHNNWDDPGHCAGFKPSQVSGNTFGSYKHEGDDPVTGEGNVFLSGKPAQNRIFIRPNKYEDDRANIVVYNWEKKDSVAVDVGAILEHGDNYEVRNGQNYYSAPLLKGTYSGENLVLPMSAGFDPARPIGGDITDQEKTGQEFNVFVLLGTGRSEVKPTQEPPVIMTATVSATPTDQDPGPATAALQIDGEQESKLWTLSVTVVSLLILMIMMYKHKFRDKLAGVKNRSGAFLKLLSKKIKGG